MAGVKMVYLADNRRQAVKAFKDWKSEWGVQYPRAIRCLEKDLDEMLNFLGTIWTSSLCNGLYYIQHTLWRDHSGKSEEEPKQ